MTLDIYTTNQSKTRLVKIITSLLFINCSTAVKAQTFPTLSTCNFDTYNSGNTQKVLMLLPGYPAAPSAPDFGIYILNNASSSLSGTNEFQQGGLDIINISGVDLSNVLIPIRGIAFWTQNIPGTTFRLHLAKAPYQLALPMALNW